MDKIGGSTASMQIQAISNSSFEGEVGITPIAPVGPKSLIAHQPWNEVMNGVDTEIKDYAPTLLQ